MKLQIKNADYQPFELASKINMSDSVARVLYNRGFSDPRSVLNYLNYKPFQLRDVEKMKDADVFLSRLQTAIEKKEHITIYGDYDADGVMSTFIWLMSLATLGNIPQWFVNNRFSEGYGLNVKGMKRLLELYPETQLIVTCDNGIKAWEGIDYAKAHGVDVIVSDHHGQSQGEPLPSCPVVCEKRLDEDERKSEWFCGAELSRRLVTALFGRMGLQREYRAFLNRLYAYSGLATVTDSITMNAANHFVVKEGLRQIGDEYDLIWKVLREECHPSAIDQDMIGFKYGPMINASGRVLGTVDLVMQAFLESFAYGVEAEKCMQEGKAYLFGPTREEQCRKAVQKLIEVNEERKMMSAEGDKIAAEIIEKSGYQEDKFLVIADERFEEGINGLIAGHLTEQYSVPSIVLCPKDGEPEIFKGSARSVEGFNVFEVLNECNDLLLGFGGHPGAAGLSIKRENISALRERLRTIAEKYVPEKETTVEVDFIATPDSIQPRLAQELNQLMPYGEGFAKPTVGFEGIIKEYRVLNDRHIKFTIDTGTTPLEIFWWNSIQNFQKQIKQLGAEPCMITCVGSAPAYAFSYGKLVAQMYVTIVELK